MKQNIKRDVKSDKLYSLLTLIFFICLGSSICFAVPSKRRAYLSTTTSLPTLSNSFVRSEKYYRAEKYQKAADELDQVLKSKDPKIIQELKENKPFYGPLKYAVESFRRYYLNEQSEYMDIGLIADLVISERNYLAEKKTEEWYSYELVLDTLEQYYGRNSNHEKTIEILEKQVYYKPNDKLRMARLLEQLLKMDRSSTKIRATIDKYKEAGGIISPKISLLECSLLEKENGKGLPAVFAWFDKNQTASKDEIIAAIEFTNSIISPDKPEDIKKYYSKLSNLALAQSSNPRRLEILSIILMSRKNIINNISNNRQEKQ